MNENVIEWLRGQDTVALTLCSGSKFANKMMKYSKSHPNEVTCHVNKDGSVFAHVPLRWLKVSPPRRMSEEQRQKAGERMRQMRSK